MEMKDRIKMIRKENGLSQVELAKRLDVSQSVISLIESGQASVSLEILKKFANEFDLSSDWLIYGKSKFIKLSTENNFIPLIGLEAQAGYLANPQDPALQQELKLFRLPGYDDDRYQMFEVEGDSMVPTIYPKDLLVCRKINKMAFIPEGELYVLVTRNGILHKRVYRHSEEPASLVLKSDNDNYNDETIPLNALNEIWSVRGKLTSRFVDQGYANAARMDRLEEELKWMKNEIESLVDLKTSKGKGGAGNGADSALPNAAVKMTQARPLGR